MDGAFFIRRLMSEIALWTENCILNVTLVCHRYSKIIALGKAVEEEARAAAHLPGLLIIQDGRSCTITLF